jgi:hypothetical protein
MGDFFSSELKRSASRTNITKRAATAAAIPDGRKKAAETVLKRLIPTLAAITPRILPTPIQVAKTESTAERLEELKREDTILRTGPHIRDCAAPFISHSKYKTGVGGKKPNIKFTIAVAKSPEATISFGGSLSPTRPRRSLPAA